MSGIIDFFRNICQREQRESSLLNSKPLLTPGEPYAGFYISVFHRSFQMQYTHIPSMMIIWFVFTWNPQLAYLDSMHAPLRKAITLRPHFIPLWSSPPSLDQDPLERHMSFIYLMCFVWLSMLYSHRNFVWAIAWLKIID